MPFAPSSDALVSSSFLFPVDEFKESAHVLCQPAISRQPSEAPPASANAFVRTLNPKKRAGPVALGLVSCRGNHWWGHFDMFVF